MNIHLVRHARAVKRVDPAARAVQLDVDRVPGRTEPQAAHASVERTARDDPPERRALNEVGWAQANALSEHFARSGSLRLISGSALRCRQTLEPLSLTSGRAIEVDERLAESASLEDLTALIHQLGDTPSVLCTHSEPIRRLLSLLGVEAPDELEQDGRPCRKGSVWTLEGHGGLAVERAVYVEPSRARASNAAALGLASAPKTLRAGVLDMGSTSFTLLVADVGRDGQIRPIAREKVMLRLGTAIASHGRLPAPLAERALEAARSMHEIALREKAEAFRAVATASLRDARNGRKVGEKIGRAIGRRVDILDGETEARLMFRAFQERLSLGGDPVLGLDLGGGSLELAAGCGRRIDRECTLALGVVRLHGELVTTDPIRRREARRIRARVQQELAPYVEGLLERGPGRLVVAGGTPRAIAQLAAAERGEESEGQVLPVDLSLEELRVVTKRLVASSHAERLEMPGIRRRRADLVATGALILESVADLLGLGRFTFCDWGLREGVLLDLLETMGPRGIERA